jgi:hypothetical protein
LDKAVLGKILKANVSFYFHPTLIFAVATRLTYARLKSYKDPAGLNINTPVDRAKRHQAQQIILPKNYCCSLNQPNANPANVFIHNFSVCFLISYHSTLYNLNSQYSVAKQTK